jgi:hypothetical protein
LVAAAAVEVRNRVVSFASAVMPLGQRAWDAFRVARGHGSAPALAQI